MKPELKCTEEELESDSYTNLGSGVKPCEVDSESKDKGWSWIVLLASFLTCAIVDGVSFSAGLFFLEFLDYFEESKSRTSLVSSVYNGVILSTGPIASVLVGKFGFRPVAIAGGLIAATGFFLSTFAPDLDTVIFTFGGLGGFGFGLLYLCAVAILGEYFDKKFALATGIALSGSGIGVFALAPVWQMLISKYSWKGAGWILSGIALNGVVIGTVYRPLQTKSEQYIQRDDTVVEQSEKCEQQCLKRGKSHTFLIRNSMNQFLCVADILGPLTVLRSPSMCLYMLLGLIFTIGYYVPLTYLPDYAVGLGISKDQAAILVSIVGVVNTLARVVIGWLADKPWANAFYIQASVELLGGVASFLCPFLKSFWMLGVYAAVYGAFIGANVPLIPVVVVELLGAERLKDTFGLVNLASGIGSLIGPPVAGLLYDSSMSYNPPFYFAGSAFITAGLLCLVVKRLDRWYKQTE